MIDSNEPKHDMQAAENPNPNPLPVSESLAQSTEKHPLEANSSDVSKESFEKKTDDLKGNGVSSTTEDMPWVRYDFIGQIKQMSLNELSSMLRKYTEQIPKEYKSQLEHEIAQRIVQQGELAGAEQRVNLSQASTRTPGSQFVFLIAAAVLFIIILFFVRQVTMRSASQLPVGFEQEAPSPSLNSQKKSDAPKSRVRLIRETPQNKNTPPSEPQDQK